MITIQLTQASKHRQKPETDLELEKIHTQTSDVNGSKFHAWTAEIENLEEVFNHINHNSITIIENPDNRFHYDDADYLVTIYDDYIE